MTAFAAGFVPLVAETTWPDVAIALIVSLPSILGAIYTIRIRREIRTPSGASIGKQIEDTQHITLANNYHLRAAGGEKISHPPESLDEVEPRFRS